MIISYNSSSSAFYNELAWSWRRIGSILDVEWLFIGGRDPGGLVLGLGHVDGGGWWSEREKKGVMYLNNNNNNNDIT
jgi:hypothetical protein